MKILIEINLYTDGDYRLENYLDYNSDGEDGYYSYYIRKFFEIDENYDKLDFHCKLNVDVKGFLEKILCDIRYSSTHYYIIKDIFNLFDNAIGFIRQLHNNSYETNFYDSIEGNYEGTNITIKVSE